MDIINFGLCGLRVFMVSFFTQMNRESYNKVFKINEQPTMRFIQNFSKAVIAVSLFGFSSLLQANPVACFNTNMGDFCMELFERTTPKTVANFIDYIDSGAYTGGVFHRSVPGFVIQGGGFKVISNDTGTTIERVNTFDPVENEPNISNTRGTVAMAKIGGDPDSATSQWFVNLADNSGAPAFLDTQNGGFTVFAEILYDGMDIFDAIADLQRVNFGGPLSTTPTINFDVSETPEIENFVVINSVALHDLTSVFDGSGLNFVVKIDESVFFDIRLRLVPETPDIRFDLESANPVSPPDESVNVATFSTTTGLLSIPSVMLNETTIVNNVIMSLSDPGALQFTVVGVEQ